MIIYLTHKDHGVMPVYSNAEAERINKLGWKIHGETHPYETKNERSEIKKKPGRPKAVKDGD